MFHFLTREAMGRLDNWVLGYHFADFYLFFANALPSMFASHA